MEITKYKGIIVKSLVILSVFALGLIVGILIGYRQTAIPLDSMRTLLMTSTTAQTTALQYLNANYKDAKDALLNYINLLDDLKSKGLMEKKYLNLKSYYVDRGLSFARLALLEEKAGNNSEMIKDMQEASKMFQMAGWEVYSEDRIRFVLDKLDKKYENKEEKGQKK
jgi:hypothetical protein